MSIEQAVQLLVTVTLIELMWSLGLRVAWQDIWQTICNRPLLLKTMLANYVCVPVATVGLLYGFQTNPLISAGFLMLAVCPGAPFAPDMVGLAKGDVSVAVGLMAILAATSAVVAPLSLLWLLPMLGGAEQLSIDATRLLMTLCLTQMAPLAAGLMLRQWFPTWAARCQGPAGRLSLILNLSSLVAILATQSSALALLSGRAVLGMSLLLAISLSAGWLLGGPLESVRRTLSLTSALRNVGLSLVIATSAFPGSPVASAVLVYGLFGIAGSLGIAFWWSQHLPTPQRHPPEKIPDATGALDPGSSSARQHEVAAAVVSETQTAVKDDGLLEESPSSMIRPGFG